jgi:hypothetical protein
MSLLTDIFGWFCGQTANEAQGFLAVTLSLSPTAPHLPRRFNLAANTLREPIDEKGAEELNHELADKILDHSRSSWRCVGDLNSREKVVPQGRSLMTDLFPAIQIVIADVECSGYAR